MSDDPVEDFISDCHSIRNDKIRLELQERLERVVNEAKSIAITLHTTEQDVTVTARLKDQIQADLSERDAIIEKAKAIGVMLKVPAPSDPMPVPFVIPVD